ncbi:hypothetical protein [Actinoplanes nipponensis]|uniref:Uncharacterized protein n=1 Tax=Actinoplanes nipponensis TaxID=135950 RepID=A0A919JJJ3_9ACTN|nr:hypothetical protein [Actinoplanes nipponensis]GIE50500.1 hypothetical protein Ani05nite_40340 [Actinoplanes nipponensis]
MRGPAGRPARLTAECALLGLVAGAAVVAPWTRAGYLLLLDWVSGPHQAINPGLYGLDPAALDALPYRLATQVLREAVGPGATSWLMILLYFPLAAGGVSALVRGGRLRRYPAALFVCCNPFVVERIQAGHVPFLVSVALLCWLLASALHARRRGHWFAARPAGWYALAMAVGPHAAWLGGAGLLAVALLPRPRRTDLVRTVLVVCAAGGIYAYALAVLASAILTVRVGAGDLQVYAPHAGPGGLPATLVSLRGFWRGAADSSPQLGLGFAPAALMVVAALTGLVRLVRHDRATGTVLAVLAPAGLLLGAGIHGPLAAAYQAAFDLVPLFAAMREQQKWVALTMIAYAAGIGAAVEGLAVACRRARLPVLRLTAAGTLLAVSTVYVAVAPSLFWGLGGSVPVSNYPASWYAADAMMGAGDEAVLFLPWHEYQPFTFTGSRTVATPAAAFFRRPVLSSDAVELGPVRTNSVSRRMAYVQRLVAAGGAGGLGRLVAPLGVRYVALARDRETGVYAWLERQGDLTRILRTPDLDLYRVEPAGTGRVVAARSGDYARAVGWAARGALGTEAVLVDGPDRGPVPSSSSGGIHRVSSTSWRVRAGAPGWVVIPEEWSPGWAAGGRPTRRTVAGTLAVEVGAGAVTVRYTPWRWLRLGLITSLLSLVVLLVAGLVEHRRELSQWWAVPGASAGSGPRPGRSRGIRRPRRRSAAS